MNKHLYATLVCLGVTAVFIVGMFGAYEFFTFANTHQWILLALPLIPILVVVYGLAQASRADKPPPQKLDPIAEAKLRCLRAENEAWHDRNGYHI